MKTLHFVYKYGIESETFVREFVKKSNTFGEALVISFENSLPNEDVIILPTKDHRRREFEGLIHFLGDRVRKLARWEKEVLNVLREQKPSIIHCHFGTTGILLLNLLSQGLINTPIVISFYGYDVSSLPKRDKTYRQKLLRLFGYKNVYSFGEGPELCKKIRSLGAAFSSVLVNPLIVPTVGVPTRSPKHGGPIKFLMIGRFVQKKGFQLALNVLGDLQRDIGPFEISIIGYGQMEQVYRRIIEEKGLEEVTYFYGKQKHHEIKEALSEHDFFLHPSLTAEDGDSEGGAPTILVEAQAAKLPVITSNHADIPYVMGYHDFIANEADVESLKSIIRSAVEFREIGILVEKGLDHVKTQHDSSISKVYENNLMEIIHNFEGNKAG